MEFELIRQHFSGRGSARVDTQLAVGDDAALLTVAPDMGISLLHTTAMPDGTGAATCFSATPDAASMLSGLLAQVPPHSRPAWVLLAVSTENPAAEWLAGFAADLDRACRHAGVELVGGDTTRGTDCVELMLLATERL